jgi:hypothetical protein
MGGWVAVLSLRREGVRIVLKSRNENAPGDVFAFRDVVGYVWERRCVAD